MKSTKIIFAALLAFLTLAACRAGKLDVEGGKPEVPKKGDMVAVFFNPNGAYWINQNNPSDKSDTGVKPSSQTIGRFVVLPPEPIFEWDIANGQRSDTKYEFVSWYQPAAGQAPLEPLLADENASDELKERFVNGGTIVNGNIKGITLYALWREPPSTQQIRITFKKFFDVTAQEELSVLVLPAVNTGVAAQDLPQNVQREHYTDAEPGKWYEVSNGAVDYTADFDLSAAITGSHTLVKKWAGNSYSLGFNANGGSPAPAGISIQYPAPVAAADIPGENDVSKSNYVLEGWYINGEKLEVGDIITEDRLYTAKWVPADSYYLDSLKVIFTDVNADKLTGKFDSNTLNYQLLINENKAFKIVAKAINPQAKITITDDDAQTAVTDIESGAAGVTLGGLITPPSGNQKRIMVIVKKSSGESLSYEVVIDILCPGMETWGGTAYNKLAGGVSDGKKITQVIAWNADRSLKGVATLTTPNAEQSGWSISMPPIPMFRPASFIVFLRDGVGSYVSDEIIPQGAPLGPSSGIEINVTASGFRITDANEFAKLGSAENRNKDFALGGDIDLAGTGTVWNGPSGYTGHFYGNGYTIKNLVLKNGDSRAGLFYSLSGAAEVRDFTLNVISENPDANVSNIYFGGVAGDVLNTSGNGVLIENVKVTGTLAVGRVTGYIDIGGIVAVTSGNAKTTIRRANSELNIKLSGTQGQNTSHCSFGGIVATAAGNLTIEDCQYTGNIEVTSDTDRMIRAGGILGCTWGNNATTTIRRTYSTGTIITDIGARTAVSSSSNDNRYVAAGGLIGFIRPTGTVYIENSAALMNKIITNSSNDVNFIYRGRLVGLSSTTAVTYTNNIVLAGAQIGNATRNSYDSSFNDNLNTADGHALNADASGLYNQNTWTNIAPNGLGWNTTVWNFSGLAQSKLPLLK